MINKTEFERLLAETNSRISVDKLLSEYRSKLDISIFICPPLGFGGAQEKCRLAM